MTYSYDRIYGIQVLEYNITKNVIKHWENITL